MAILKNNGNSTYDLPPPCNGVNTLLRSPKFGTPQSGNSAIALQDYAYTKGNTGAILSPNPQRPISGPEPVLTMSNYNQAAFNPATPMFAPMTPMFQAGAPYQTPQYAFQ